MMNLRTPFQRILLRTCGATTVLAASGSLSGATILRVDGDSGSPAGNGDSWSTAYKYLQDALAEATENATQLNPYNIWVTATGTANPYRPDRSAATPNGSDPIDRTATFRLARNIAVYGGFLGLDHLTLPEGRRQAHAARPRQQRDGPERRGRPRQPSVRPAELAIVLQNSHSARLQRRAVLRAGVCSNTPMLYRGTGRGVVGVVHSRGKGRLPRGDLPRCHGRDRRQRTARPHGPHRRVHHHRRVCQCGRGKQRRRRRHVHPPVEPCRRAVHLRGQLGDPGRRADGRPFRVGAHHCQRRAFIRRGVAAKRGRAFAARETRAGRSVLDRG